MDLNLIIRKRGVQVGAAATVFLAVAVSLAVMSASPGSGNGAPDPLVAGDTTGGVAVISASNGLNSESTRTAAQAAEEAAVSGTPAGATPSASLSTPGQSGSDNDGSATSPENMLRQVRIMWWNDTEDVPVEGFLISIGASSWSPDEAADSDTGALSVTVGKPSVLVVYPDGPGGSRVEVPILFEKMMKDDSEQDAIIVEVSDERIRVLGNPVENVDQTFDRF